MNSGFENFTPEYFMESVEDALETPMSGYASALASYINRVYELETALGERVIAKFYRPGRWSRETILDEHDFLWECDEADINVVAPYELANGSTLSEADGVLFAVFPKKRGREAEFESVESLRKIGSLLGRIHSCGAARPALNRMTMTPHDFGFAAMERIFNSGAVHKSSMHQLEDVCNDIIDLSEEIFPAEDTFIRIHGDFHRANVLDRMDEGLLAIDFDDMLNGPQVQDMWLLLPDTPSKCSAEVEAMLGGYTMFMDFDESTLNIVEALRAMRMMHFLSWCAIQTADARFRENFPDWGTESFWRRETADFVKQFEAMKKESSYF